MHTMKKSLVLALGLVAPCSFASIVPVTDEIVEASLQSIEANNYLEAYIQLNKSAKTVSLILQPKMPKCPEDRFCAAVMPEARDYYLENLERSVDSCQSVHYRGEQQTDSFLKVTIIDNSQYDYQQCPTLVPVDETVVQVEQIFYNASEEIQVEEMFAGSHLRSLEF